MKTGDVEQETRKERARQLVANRHTEGSTNGRKEQLKRGELKMPSYVVAAGKSMLAKHASGRVESALNADSPDIRRKIVRG